MKKLLITTFIFIVSFFAFSITTYATPGTEDKTDITRLFNTWELEENAGIFTVTSNRIENNANWITAEIDTGFWSSEAHGSDFNFYNFVVAGYGAITSRVEVFSDATTIHRSAVFHFVYEAPQVTQVMFLSNGNRWRADIDQGMHYSITFVLNENLTASQRNRVVSVMNAGGSWGDITQVYLFTIYSFTTIENRIILDPTDPNDYAQLPTTSGSIFNEQPLAHVDIVVDGYSIEMEIRYDTVYFVHYTFSAETDMSIFNENYEVFYYTHEGVNFVIFNHGTESMFTQSGERLETFIPYTIWNLQTNEISTINQFNVYMHVRQEDAQNVFAYFYVDEFVIDNLLSVTTFMQYRYISIFGGQGEWTSHHRILEHDIIIDGNISWKIQAAAISTVATGIGAMIPVIGLPILIVGAPISLYLQYLSFQEMMDGNMLWIGDINEIEQVVNPSTSLKSEIAGGYHEADSDFAGLDLDTFTLWKLHLGTFNKPFQDRIEIREGSLSVIQFKYQTDGRVYTIDTSEINMVVNLGELEETPDIPGDNILDRIIDPLSKMENIGVYLAIAGGIIFLMVLPKIHRSYKNVRKGASLLFTPFGLITAAIIVIGILYLLGKL